MSFCRSAVSLTAKICSFVSPVLPFDFLGVGDLRRSLTSFSIASENASENASTAFLVLSASVIPIAIKVRQRC